MKCECWNIKHARACGKEAIVTCTECNDELCADCATKHHFHSTFVMIQPSKDSSG